MKKYTPVFGPQELFDGALPNAAIMCSDETWHHDLNAIPKLIAQGKIPVAARFIEETPVPKRWTAEDHKAGKLPYVGDEYDVDGCIVEHLGNGAAGYQNILYFKYPSGACGNAHERLAKPIETPDEKAVRLKSEWCAKAAKQLKNLEYTSTLTSIYDAILSGELPPVQAKDGA